MSDQDGTLCDSAPQICHFLFTNGFCYMSSSLKYGHKNFKWTRSTFCSVGSVATTRIRSVSHID